MRNRPIRPHEHVQIVIGIQPKAFRPPALAAMVGTTAFFVEECWRDGSLKFKIIGSARVSTIEQIDMWLASFEEQSGTLPGRGKYLRR
jgi:hypothetical protein